jgi:hypothetical protein
VAAHLEKAGLLLLAEACPVEALTLGVRHTLGDDLQGEVGFSA